MAKSFLGIGGAVEKASSKIFFRDTVQATCASPKPEEGFRGLENPRYPLLQQPLHSALPIALLLVSCLLLTGCPTAPHPVEYPDVTAPQPAPPRLSGGYYRIRKGDTLYSIARENGVDWRDIVEANSWIDPLDLPVGKSILIPGVRNPLAPGETETSSGDSHAIHPGHDGPLAAERKFVWPLRGRIAASYGKSVPWRMWTTNHGIDIRAQTGRSVIAAKSGRVSTFASVPGFGRAVVLEHTDGTTTFYGHLGRVLVKHGRWVKQGEEIGLAGKTSGATSGTALHFRILRDGSAVNPLFYLPN